MEIILDTSAVIELLEGTKKGRKLLEAAQGNTVSTTVFTLYEVRRKQKSLESVKAMRIQPFSADASGLAAKIGTALESSGREMQHIDLFIACIALAKNALLATTDKGFRKIKELKIIEL